MSEPPGEPEGASDPATFAEARRRMVETQIIDRGIRDHRTVAAMASVPREAFVPDDLRHQAYADRPLPIGVRQTISQPYIVAAMAEAARLAPGDRVLEVGTGSGYSAAVLATMVREVYTIETVASLVESARQRLADLGYRNVHVRHGDGSVGWREHSPYDAIVVTAGGPEVPPSLLRQLTIGGRLVMPVGGVLAQRLVRVVRTAAESYERERLEDVSFVPLIGSEGWTS